MWGWRGGSVPNVKHSMEWNKATDCKVQCVLCLYIAMCAYRAVGECLLTARMQHRRVKVFFFKQNTSVLFKLA